MVTFIFFIFQRLQFFKIDLSKTKDNFRIILYLYMEKILKTCSRLNTYQRQELFCRLSTDANISCIYDENYFCLKFILKNYFIPNSDCGICVWNCSLDSWSYWKELYHLYSDQLNWFVYNSLVNMYIWL